MQRAFRCLASLVQCHALHPRKTYRPSVRPLVKRSRGKEEEKERTCIVIISRNGIRYDRLPAKRAGSEPSTDAEYGRRGTWFRPRPSVVAFNRADRPRNVTPVIYATTVTIRRYVRGRDNETDADPLSPVNDTWGVNDGIARRRRRAGTREEERTPATRRTFGSSGEYF